MPVPPITPGCPLTPVNHHSSNSFQFAVIIIVYHEIICEVLYDYIHTSEEAGSKKLATLENTRRNENVLDGQLARDCT